MGEKLRPFSLIHALTIMTKPTITCHFWNVGQGLFSSGKIALPNNHEFVWVYDCGSISKSPLHLSRAISTMKNIYTSPQIDLLAISHFDQDHINGLAQLLQNRSVKTLWLPYYPLYQRLIIANALALNKDSDDLIECYISPIQYFSKKYNIEKILLVSDNSHNDNKEALINMELSLVEDKNISVSFFDMQKDSTYFNVEFVPYNVPFNFIKRNLKQVNLSESHINALLNNNTQNISQKFNNIKKYYYQTLNIQGKNQSIYRNRLSLYLYIGTLTPAYFNSITYYQGNQYNFLFTENHKNPLASPSKIKDSILYCGDGAIEIDKRLQHLVSTLTPQRIERIACLQVPHHGSRHNWKPKLSRSYIQPNISVFCADPYAKYKHPHPDVVFDLIKHNPILVDTNYPLTLIFQ